MADGTKADWDEPKVVTDFPRPIPDAELAFLQRVRPGTALPELREFLLQWWIQTMKLGERPCLIEPCAKRFLSTHQ